MKKTSLIFIAGHGGMVGSAIVRALTKNGYKNLLLAPKKELDLMNQKAVFSFFEKHKPEYVFLAAAKVGGIVANNTFRADFIYQNLMIETNVIEASRRSGVTKLLFLGSSCIYPKFASQPIAESELLTGSLEPTNEYYAVAKIAGIKLCEAYRDQYGCNYISIMPTNLYGPNDNYDKENSHVVPAMIRRFHEAKINNTPEVIIWGTGSPKREFLHVDDLASASIFLMNTYNERSIINVGTGVDITIKELAQTIKKVTNYTGKLTFDATRPDGTQRKLLNMEKLHSLGWKHSIIFEDGIKKTYSSFLKELKDETIRRY